MRESDSRTAAIRAGDRDTLAIVVHESLPPLLRAARGAGLEPTDAEDVTQDVLLSFVAKAHQFDGRARVLTYLFGILYRKIAELRRKSWRRELGVDDIESIVASRFDHTGRWIRPPRGPEEDHNDLEIRHWVGECLETLPDQQRAAFVLREVEDRETDEICGILEITSNHLGVLFHRARHRLRECLERMGFDGS